MLPIIASISVGALIGFIFGSIYYVIFNDPEGVDRKSLHWLLGIYVSIGQAGGGIAIQIMMKENRLTCYYLISCTLIFLILAAPAFYYHNKTSRIIKERELKNSEDLDELI